MLRTVAGDEVLDGVVCSVDTCMYHTKGNRCAAGSIAVRMEKDNPSKKDETLCSTFEKA
jgi:hypothetical protein